MSVISPFLPSSHLIIPFASCSAEGWLPAMQALQRENLPQLARLLQGMALVQTDTRDAATLSPPHERALAQALDLASDETPDGLIPWAASDAAEQLQPGSEQAGKAWAWITPCHWAMGHLHATLSDPAALALREDESRALLAIMQAYFETDGIRLHYLTPERWLAEGELFRQLPTASLDRVLARNVDAWLPDSPNAAPLRRLQNEMQMLLYTHPFNDARDANRQLPVNSFWLSGTGDLPAACLPGKAEISAPRDLAQAVFKEDWIAYGEAWGRLDSGAITQLLARQRAGESVRLTLCGEQSAQTFETSQTGFFARISSFFAPTSILNVVQQL
ncbi:hypothetical protein [Polaromonas sp.]|uniref:hypothetical protein n=1 Tax=Polaromonas sp. TaxID=1869339 RepID=UPI0018024F74|nr:hypothetical protein [Polaromonas sp.]NML87388.1 hypothetical protein [Polaromonas sp.]